MDIHSIISAFIPVAKAAAEETAAKGGGPAAVLGLNLKLFIAQLVNFGVVLFILWKFVFGPVAKKLQQRTETIEKAMADAAGTEKEKQEFEVWKQTEMNKARSEASSIVTQAQNEAIKAKDVIMSAAKEEQDKMLQQTKKLIEQEKSQALQSAKAELADLITMTTEKLIRTKLDEKKDKDLIKQTLSDLK